MSKFSNMSSKCTMSPMSAMMSPGLNHVMSPGVTSSLVGGASAMSPAYPPGESSAPQAPVGTSTGAAAADEMEDEPYICRWIDCGMVFKVCSWLKNNHIFVNVHNT